jgi:hypothetical protein
MGAKAGLEYEVKHVKLGEGGWAADCPVLVSAIDGMAAEGWVLVSLAMPNNTTAMLAFSRPRAAPPDEGRPGGAATPPGGGA